MDWTSLIDRGYIHVPGLVAPDLVARARAAIDDDLARNYDPAREDEYSGTTYCPTILDAPPLTDLLQRSGARELLDAALGLDALTVSPAQIAIRWARNVDRELPPEPHLDGVMPDRIANMTAILGVFLTTMPRTFAGNLAVWPGSHRSYERAFRERGPRSVFEPLPTIELGEPEQLVCAAGDVVLMHWSLAHSAAVNTSDVDRVAVYFRLMFPELSAARVPDLGEGRWEYLSNLWRNWRIAA
jgi:hypothetical protein